MKSAKRGKSTSIVEVTNISIHGLWIFVLDREYFIPFSENPWFKNAKIGELQHVQLFHGHHLHWPDLDVDLELDSLADPEKYPLVYKE
jgi:hypothetical protein